MLGSFGYYTATRPARHYSDDAQEDLRAYLEGRTDIMLFRRGANMNTDWENYQRATLEDLVRRAEDQKKRIRDALDNRDGKICHVCGCAKP